MAFDIVYSPEAVAQLSGLRAFDRAAVIQQVNQVLTTNPALESRVRVKRLRQPAPTEYRLRVNDYRIFYNIKEDKVFIVQVLDKDNSVAFLEGPK